MNYSGRYLILDEHGTVISDETCTDWDQRHAILPQTWRVPPSTTRHTDSVIVPSYAGLLW